MADTTKYMGDRRAGLHNVGSYQVSGVPYLSGSVLVPLSTDTIKLSFPSVTKEIVFSNTGANAVRIGYSLFGLVSADNDNWFTIASGASFTHAVKVDDVYMTALVGTSTVDVAAALTHIGIEILNENNINHWSGSIGVG